QELGVVVSAGQAVQQTLRGFRGVGGVGADHRGHAAYQPDLAQRLGVEEQLLAPGAAAGDVDGREDAPFGQTPIQVQFHVTGALELLVDDLVHAAAGVYQTGRDDGEATAFVRVAGGAEEALGRVERYRVD